MKSVQHYAGGVAEGIGFNDVHPPASEYAGNGGEKRGAVGGEQRQGKGVLRGEQTGLYRIAVQFLIHGEMLGNLLHRMHREIATRKSFEEAFDGFRTGGS